MFSYGQAACYPQSTLIVGNSLHPIGKTGDFFGKFFGSFFGKGMKKVMDGHKKNIGTP